VIVDVHPKEFKLYQMFLTALDKSVLHILFCGYYNYDWKNYIYGSQLFHLRSDSIITFTADLHVITFTVEN